MNRHGDYEHECDESCPIGKEAIGEDGMTRQEARMDAMGLCPTCGKAPHVFPTKEEHRMALTQKGLHYGKEVVATIGGQDISKGELADIMEIAYWALHISGHYEDVAGYLDASDAKLNPLRRKITKALM